MPDISPGVKQPGVNLTTELLSQPRLRMSGAIPPPCLHGMDTVNVNWSITLFKHSCIVSFHAVISKLLKALLNSPQPRLSMSHTRTPQFYLATSTHKNSKCSHLVTILFLLLPSALHTEACFVYAEAKLIAETQQWAVHGPLYPLNITGTLTAMRALTRSVCRSSPTLHSPTVSPLLLSSSPISSSYNNYVEIPN